MISESDSDFTLTNNKRTLTIKTVKDVTIARCNGMNSEGTIDVIHQMTLESISAWGPPYATTSCNVTCGKGSQLRTRTCVSPTGEAVASSMCEGDAFETIECIKPECPIDGGWSDYGVKSLCSRTCGVGYQVQERVCNNPVPQNGGKECKGKDKFYSYCEISVCPEKTI